MRKHHKRWVALFSAAAISTTGLMGVSGTAVADDKDSQALNWPLITQGVSTYSLDGYEIGYLPPGLERYGISASSTTDRQGNRQSQIAWTQGPDQLYGRVTVVRSEAFQELDDLRQGRYGHLPTGELERLEPNETFTDGAFLSEESGDLFWLEEPGVAVTTHLQPDRWGGNELVKFATSVEASEVESEVADAAEAENADADADAEDGAQIEPAADPPQAEEAPAEEAPEAEAPAEEAPAEEAPAEEAPAEETPDTEVPAEEAPEAEAPEAEAPEAEAPAEEAPAEETPAEEAPEAEAPAEEPAPETEAPAEEAPEAEAPAEEAPEAEAPTEEAPAEEAPAEEAPAEETPAEEAPEAEAPTEEAPAEEAPEAEAPVEEAPEGEAADDADSRQVKECLIDQFVDFGSGETVLDADALTPDSGAFVEQALTKGDLNDAERDRLLATVWYYGAEEQKTAATSECARANDMDTAEVEAVLAEVSDQIAALVQEAEAATTEGMDQVSQTGQDGEVAEQAEIDPVDAQEWQELWESLPWSIPAEADTSGS